MEKRICFIHTDTNNLHKTNDDVTKKNLYKFARLVKLNYEIGQIVNNKFVTEKKVNQIIKPRCMYISQELTNIHGISHADAEEKGIDPEIVINEFKNDIKKINIIISHNVDFHLRTLIAESLRYNIMIDYNKYIIIDTISFVHNYNFIKLKDLAKILFKKENKTNDNLKLIKKVFFNLYSQYCQT